jgi:hypothetical protein
MKKHKVFVGDTLVEVMFAVGIFCLVAIGVVSVMNSSSSKIQQSLEITMTRNEIDTQAEALRYIHSSYNSERNQKEAGNIYSDFWKKIVDPNRVVPEDKVDSVLSYQPSSCSALYGEEGEARKYGFIIDYKHLGDILSTGIDSNKLIIDKDKLKTATLYPRILYGVDDTLYSSSSGSIKNAEGLYIIAVADIQKTNVVQESDEEAAAAVVQSAFYDFYIRSCWQAPGSNQPTLTSTLIRLNDPDLQGVKFQLSTFELRFHNVVGGVGEVPGTMSALDKTPTYNFQIPATPLPKKGGQSAIGWIRDVGAGWTGVGACPKDKFYLPDTLIGVGAANPSVDLYAVYRCVYSLTFFNGAGTVQYQTFTHDEPAVTYKFNYDAVRPSDPTESGHTFIGWSNSKNPDYNQKNDLIVDHESVELSVPDNSAASAYAIFRPNYNISFDLNGGDGATPAPRGGDSMTLCQEFTLPHYDREEDIPTKTGFVFKGWSTSPNAEQSEFIDNKISMPYGCNTGKPTHEYAYDVKLYAVWGIFDREITIKLIWDSKDYDSHIYGTLRNGTPFRAYFGQKGISEDNNDPVAELDKDEMSGGTETFKLHTYGGKTYYYSVHNWSGQGARIEQNARVEVYFDDDLTTPKYTYYASDAKDYIKGYWHVFAYKGGKIVPCNKYGSSFDKPPDSCYQ